MSEKIPLKAGDGTAAVQAVLDRARHAGAEACARDDIIGSWHRSAGAGLRPEVFEVPYDGDVDEGGVLAWAAGPVLERLGSELDHTKVGLLLTDDRGLVVRRHSADRETSELLDEIHLAPGFGYGEARVGTNAIGTALTLHVPTVVQGEEHFADALTRMACAATTVTDPRTGRVLGVVDLSCAADSASPLMLPLVKRAAWEIEQRLLGDGPLGERALIEAFRHTTRANRGPLLAVSRRSVLANTAAADVLGAVEHHEWWDRLQGSLTGGTRTGTIPAPDGSPASWEFRAVYDGATVVGALLFAASTPHTENASRRPRRSTGRGFGWGSLTDTEIAVALKITAGMTNREAAASLFVSPHTIDFHLRQLFRKLEVRSRVELTRVVLEHEEQTSGRSGDFV